MSLQNYPRSSERYYPIHRKCSHKSPQVSVRKHPKCCQKFDERRYSKLPVASGCRSFRKDALLSTTLKNIMSNTRLGIQNRRSKALSGWEGPVSWCPWSCLITWPETPDHLPRMRSKEIVNNVFSPFLVQNRQMHRIHKSCPQKCNEDDHLSPQRCRH